MKIVSLTFLALVLAVSACSGSKPKRVVKSFSAVSGDSSGDNSSGSPADEGNDELGQGGDVTRPGDGGEGGSNENETNEPGQIPDKGEPRPGDDTVSDPMVPNDPPEVKPIPDPVIPKPEPDPKPVPDPDPDPVDASCHKGDAFICEIERIINVETNKLRATAGKGALVHAKDHCYISRLWSEEMAKIGRISHDGFPAQRKSDYQKEFGKSTNYFAENVAMLSDGGTDAAKIANKFVNMWWNSAGHKANMLGNHKNIGSGVGKKGNSYYATQLFN